MPRFSVIVPAYQVQAYLPACLESVLSQSYDDLELIVVDDRSPDACGEIADEFAARDPRVRAVHRARNEGLGPARNTGIAEATGDYLVFLDGDDTLAPHALRSVADRLKETGEPDVLVHGHALVPWSGEIVRASAPGLLTEEGPAQFRLEDRPGLLRMPAAAWNKVCRREFAEREGFAFPPGRHTDLPWTCPVLMTAESITTLDRVCVHHRLRRRSVPAGAGRRDFDVFDQYDRVFAYVDTHPELAQWRPVLFRRMVDDLWAVFSGRGRLPRDARAEFLRRARELYRAHLTPGHPAPVGSRLRHTTIRLGLYRTQRTLELAQLLGRRIAEPTVRLTKALHAAALRLHYRVQLRLPVREDRAVFAVYGGRGHGCNPGALEEAFRSLAPHIRTAWAADPEHHRTIPTATRRLTPDTAAYWTALARSKYLVNNTDFDRRLVKRPGQVLVQTQHGTPLKHMGLDLQERPAAAGNLDFAAMLRGADQWDYLVSPNRHATLTWERALPGGYTVLPYGHPRNDVFQRATSEDVRRLRESLGVPEGTVAILYAPTHRDYRRTQRTTLDLERLLRRLGPRFVVLARAHHRHGGPLAPASTPRVIDVSDHPSVESLCLASDALVTDYSSLMFDYAGLDRPIVIHADDREAYEAARGTYFDLRSFAPGAIARSEDELIDIFATGHWRGSRSTQLRSAFRERFCPYDDGRAAERVVRHVVLGEPESPSVIPPAERHPVPSAAAASDRSPLTTVPRPAAEPTVTETL
ncbi:bifunctional glycosyltransferase family 2 protein/CDP-glycerol:glycerophosphate glycerophosphotransferase [Streptomyces griseorubiginosus]|uniref:bifunctional glycosyltransferase/CDP-glycerol:glycerophosphate glycerophosphotransferase n=1 Tax=Streptomyces griseorubiginosus TaxID=67304 RepID=UPI002E810EE2|nr:bifunctional glycosyltransferase family 2 protein/CDP-glycerol:glycerophosphate glycerophosphotransferase [Streptomyces griseorubiginosus]WUB46662.1 bifunctional glycosyltransferase family 2 protein/CDP-glycerol:glycerophosphate glycerophosphotransferase [Streptomyces griseorubiginosus]WUB55184.1 bifunctional glycosyltransferase family 2 protein/CDP-glycerol:glycerophosphate glycerophosphotransferase [Streptomyces griseorubiginosus]